VVVVPSMSRTARPRLRKRQRWLRVLGILSVIAIFVLAAIIPKLRTQDSPSGESGIGGVLKHPVEPSQQTLVSFGDRSHWLQPWRGYLDTVPAMKLRDAVGININNTVTANEVSALARLLAANGFKRARYEIGWGSIDYDNPQKLKNIASVRQTLIALRQRGIRPLILLNSHHAVPCPTHFFDAQVLEAASRGDRHLRLAQATARAVVPGRTGLNAPDGKAADILFKAVQPGGVVTLSKPLPRDLPPGRYPAATLRYAPFGPPRRPDGSPNPAFERTLRGWLRYVDVVTHEVRKVLGSDDFDVEIWNELTFGSDFLYSDRYYDPPPPGEGDPTRTIPDRTVAWLREPANGVSRVGISNGFESQRPWASGANSPTGLTAISKHPYKNMRRFPQDSVNDSPGIRPLDALGHTDGVFNKATNRWRDNFVPTYHAFLPEYYLTAIQTENLIRDLSPITTDVSGTRHGRRTHPPHSSPPTVWITETNLDPSGADLSRPGAAGGKPVAKLTSGDRGHLQAKAVLRYLTAFVNKGVPAIYFYAAKDPNLGLVDSAFFTALERGGYPGDDSGGETMLAVRRLIGALRGAIHLSRTRPISLLAISDNHNHRQFNGDGSAAHPPLYDRDVVAFFPYQVTNRRYVVPVYVMTRNLAKLYKPDARLSDRNRFDLPPESFRLTIKIPGVSTLRASANDPLTGESVPVKIISRDAGRLTVELPLTDSPRLLTLDTG
jgi:hypothetical protein